MGVSYVKFCPRCETTTAVDSALCPNCGHQFRTHFQSPVSEKTIAMTAGSTVEESLPGPRPLREAAPRRPLRLRPRLRPRFVLVVAALAVVGLVYGAYTRRAQQPAPAPRTAFQPYDVVIKDDAQGDSAPVATQSASDLQQWKATQPARATLDDAGVGDDPARVHLYLSKRIVLVPQGSVGRVLLEQGEWRRVQILDGLCRGTTGFISRDAFVRLEELVPQGTPTRAATR